MTQPLVAAPQVPCLPRAALGNGVATTASTATAQLSAPLVLDLCPVGGWWWRARAAHAAKCASGTAGKVVAGTSPAFGNGEVVAAALASSSADGTANVASAESSGGEAVADFDALYVDQEPEHVFQLNPAEWKEQDHYEVLGLSKMRWRASDDDIKRAYRRKALKHHPDKANDSKAWNPASESYFKCVQKAYEYMSEPAKRRLFDSVDPCFDDDLPDAASIVEATSASGSDGFVSLFAPVFERNAHFSTRQPVPTIGDGSTTAANRTHVEAFYAFWCAFDSWRSFDLRLDIPEDVENRDERRYVEKQVKAERVKLKKEEKQRLLRLVNLAMKHDPRLAAWKEQDRAEKDAKRLAREEAVRKQAEDEVRAKQLAAEAEEKLRIDEQSRREAEKKEKETRKRDLRLARKEFRTVLEQRLGAAAFATVSTAVEDYLKTTEMVLERVRDAIADLPYINDVTQLREMMTTGARPLRTATASTTSNGESMITATTTKQQQKPPVTPTVVSTAAAVPVPQAKEAARPWTEEESRLLIKAVKTYPGGTKNRWPTVAEYVALHSQQPERTTAEIMQHIKDTATVPPKSNILPTTPMESTPAATESNEMRPWSAAEQATLEKALRTYPASAHKGPDRWDKVASMVEGRTKKEVVLRVKALVAKANKK